MKKQVCNIQSRTKGAFKVIKKITQILGCSVLKMCFMSANTSEELQDFNIIEHLLKISSFL